MCGSLLAQLGATVVVVEPPAAQPVAGKWLGIGAQFTAGKLSFQMDSTKSADRDLLRSLIARCDALVVSSEVDGGLDGFLPAGLEAEKIVCDVTAYGRTGPRAGQPGSEWQVQALSGIVETTGMANEPPVPIPLPIVRVHDGHVCGGGDPGRAARASDSAPASDRHGALRLRVRGDGDVHAAAASREQGAAGAPASATPIAPWNVYKARDGWALISVGNDAQWQRLCEIMPRSDYDLRAAPAEAGADCARGRDRCAVAAWVGGHSVGDCVATLTARDPQRPVVRIEGIRARPTSSIAGMIRRLRDPLSGARRRRPRRCA